MKRLKKIIMTMMVVCIFGASFVSCAPKSNAQGKAAMTIEEAINAIERLSSGKTIDIVLDARTTEITEELKEALQDENKKVNLDLSRTKISVIEWKAFFGCTSLSSIILPNSITEIGELAFGECTSLTSITIPNGVTEIGQGAFGYCTSLTSITIPNNVTEIEKGTFVFCTSLTSITIPNGVTGIGEMAFGECKSLADITIPSSVTGIGEFAFGGCKSLADITIPSSVTLMEEFAFPGTLETITYTGTKNSWKSIKKEKYSFLGSGPLIVHCSDGDIRER